MSHRVPIIILAMIAAFSFSCTKTNRVTSSQRLQKEGTIWKKRPNIDISHEYLRPHFKVISNTLIYDDPEMVSPALARVDTTSISTQQLKFIAELSKRINGDTYPTPLIQVGGIVAEVSANAYQKAGKMIRSMQSSAANSLFYFLGLGGADDFNSFCNNYWKNVSICRYFNDYQGYIKHFELDLLLHAMFYQIQTTYMPNSQTPTLREDLIKRLETDLELIKKLVGPGNFSVILAAMHDFTDPSFDPIAKTAIMRILKNYPEVKMLLYSPGQAKAPTCVPNGPDHGFYKVGIPSLSWVDSQLPGSYKGYLDIYTGFKEYRVDAFELDTTMPTPIHRMKSSIRFQAGKKCQ